MSENQWGNFVCACNFMLKLKRTRRDALEKLLVSFTTHWGHHFLIILRAVLNITFAISPSKIDNR
jgi:hypothetical protein